MTGLYCSSYFVIIKDTHELDFGYYLATFQALSKHPPPHTAIGLHLILVVT